MTDPRDRKAAERLWAQLPEGHTMLAIDMLASALEEARREGWRAGMGEALEVAQVYAGLYRMDGDLDRASGAGAVADALECLLSRAASPEGPSEEPGT